MIRNLIKYLKIYFKIIKNVIKENYINLIIIKIKNPRLLFSRFIKLKMGNNAIFLSNSNKIHNNTNIEIAENGVFNLRKSSWIGPFVNININSFVLGKYSAVHSFGTIIGDVRIGDYVMVAKNVFISSGKHHYDLIPEIPIKMQDLIYSKENGSLSETVIIDDDVWIAVNCTIMSGVRIGKGAIVGSNSVVTKNVEPYTIVAGNPAKIIKKRFEFIPPKSINASNKDDLIYFYSGFNIEKEPFVMLDEIHELEALSSFSVSLNIENEKQIYLKIKSINEEEKLVFQNQVHIVNKDYSLVKFNIKNKKSILDFSSENKSNSIDVYKFKIEKVYLV